MDRFKGNGEDIFGNEEGVINNLCKLFLFQNQGDKGKELVGVDIFKASQEELIKSILEKDAILEGYVAENDALRKNVDNLVKAKIIADRKNSELERRAVECEIAWKESYNELQRWFKESEVSVEELKNSLLEKESDIKELEKRMLVVRGYMSEIGKTMLKFSSQEKRLQMLPRLERILNIHTQFVEKEAGERGKRKKSKE